MASWGQIHHRILPATLSGRDCKPVTAESRKCLLSSQAKGGFGFPESPFRKIPLVHTYAHRGASKHVQAREGCSTILGNSQQYHKRKRGHQRKQVCPGRVRLHYHRGSDLCLVDTPTQASPITLGEGETARVVTHLLLLFPKWSHQIQSIPSTHQWGYPLLEQSGGGKHTPSPSVQGELVESVNGART